MASFPWIPKSFASEALHKAVSQNEYENVQNILVEGHFGCHPDINHKKRIDESYFMTPLMCACDNGFEDIVGAILTHRAEDVEVNLVNERGMSALRYAVGKKHVGIVQKLMQREELDVESVGPYGNSLLHDATSTDSPEVAKLLLKRREVFVNVVDKNGWTPFYLAAMWNKQEVLRVLFRRKGIDVNKGMGEASQNWFAGQIPFHCALRHNAMQAVNLFVKYASARKSKRTRRNLSGRPADRKERGGWRGKQGAWVRRGKW